MIGFRDGFKCNLVNLYCDETEILQVGIFFILELDLCNSITSSLFFNHVTLLSI